MPAKGGNSNKESGRAKKADNENKKAVEAAAMAEAAEAAEWDKGAKGKSAVDVKAEKAAEAARKKAEKAALEAEDDANTPSTNKASGGGGGGGPKRAGKKPSAVKAPAAPGIDDAIASFTASSLDDALDAMTLVNEKSDSASRGAAAGQIERHPERRFKAAFEAYKERELPIVKQEYKGLRLNQYHDLLYKQFQKHPDNPFNQLTVTYDATKEEKLAALQTKRKVTEKRLKD